MRLPPGVQLGLLATLLCGCFGGTTETELSEVEMSESVEVASVELNGVPGADGFELRAGEELQLRVKGRIVGGKEMMSGILQVIHAESGVIYQSMVLEIHADAAGEFDAVCQTGPVGKAGMSMPVVLRVMEFTTCMVELRGSLVSAP